MINLLKQLSDVVGLLRMFSDTPRAHAAEMEAWDLISILGYRSNIYLLF